MRTSRIQTAVQIRAFSLVELLVVIAIVAVLLSSLLPSLKAARDNSKAMLCLSAERQIYGIFNQYAYDNKQYIPHFSYYWQKLAVGGYLEQGQTYVGAANGVRYRQFKCAGDEGAVCAGDPAAAIKPMFDNPGFPPATG